MMVSVASAKPWILTVWRMTPTLCSLLITASCWATTVSSARAPCHTGSCCRSRSVPKLRRLNLTGIQQVAMASDARQASAARWFRHPQSVYPRGVSSPALQFLILTVAGWLGRHQVRVVEYLLEENRILRHQLGGRRLRLTDAQRRRLAVRARGEEVRWYEAAESRTTPHRRGGRRSRPPDGYRESEVGNYANPGRPQQTRARGRPHNH